MGGGAVSSQTVKQLTFAIDHKSGDSSDYMNYVKTTIRLTFNLGGGVPKKQTRVNNHIAV